MSRRTSSRRDFSKKAKIKFPFGLIFKIGFFVFIAGVLAGLSFFIYITKDLPRPEEFTERQVIESTRIYDRTGTVLLYEIYGEEKRTIVPLNEISENLKNAMLSTEDVDFYKHHGIDLKSIARAIMVDLKIQRRAQGASTISQQLIRSA